MERWVVNASPIICLAKSGQLNILFDLAEELVVPAAVAREIEAGATDDPARSALAAGQWKVTEVRAATEILSWDLGSGETAVLSYA